MKNSLILFISLFASITFGQILPPNNLDRYDDVKRTRNISEADFNRIITEIETLWKPYAANHGAKLEIKRLWTNKTVNAMAKKKGNTWYVYMYGGLARRPEVTQDGFALVVCHELGHHFAGHYYYKNSDMAGEGQSDYFGTQACLKKLWESVPAVSTSAPAAVMENCDAVWTSQSQRERCYRSSLAGQSLANLLASLGKDPEPSFTNADTKKVTKTNTSHPEAQCRLDTYFQGALCSNSLDYNVIPALNNPSGRNSKDAEREAGKHSCMDWDGFTRGTRPACWFATQVK